MKKQDIYDMFKVDFNEYDLEWNGMSLHDLLEPIDYHCSPSYDTDGTIFDVDYEYIGLLYFFQNTVLTNLDKYKNNFKVVKKVKNISELFDDI